MACVLATAPVTDGQIHMIRLSLSPGLLSRTTLPLTSFGVFKLVIKISWTEQIKLIQVLKVPIIQLQSSRYAFRI